MPYRNKTFVSFASEDISSYRLMQAWRTNQNIVFDFYDAHNLNTALDSSQRETIERRLSERLANTKQVVMLIGDATRSKAGDGFSFVHHEVTVIKRLAVPVVFANLNGSRDIEISRLPTDLQEMYSVSVSFQPAIIRYALDGYVEAFQQNSTKPLADRRSGPHYYEPATYRSLGL